MEIGAVIEKLRRERKLTQSDLARALSVSVGTVSNYENGVHYPDPEMIMKLMDFFDVSADYLLGRTDCRSSVSVLNEYVTTEHKVSDFVDMLLAVDEKRRDSVILYAQFLKSLQEDGD